MFSQRSHGGRQPRGCLRRVGDLSRRASTCRRRNRSAPERTGHEPQRDRQLHLGVADPLSATPSSPAGTGTSSCPLPCCAGSTACWSPPGEKVLAVRPRFKGRVNNLDPQFRRASGSSCTTRRATTSRGCSPTRPHRKDGKRDQDAVRDEHDGGAAGRLGAGLPRISDGQRLLLLDMLAHVRCRAEGGSRVAIIMKGLPLCIGDAGSGESEICRVWDGRPRAGPRLAGHRCRLVLRGEVRPHVPPLPGPVGHTATAQDGGVGLGG